MLEISLAWHFDTDRKDEKWCIALRHPADSHLCFIFPRLLNLWKHAMSHDVPLIFVFYVSILFPLSPPLLPLSSPGFLLSPPLLPLLFWPPAEIESNPRGHLRQPRTLGLAIVPGEHIVSIAIAKNYVSEPPPAQPVSPQSHTEQTLPESSELSHTHTDPSEMPHTLPVTSDS